jgi:methylase of polypeptide subunit release factors
MISRMQGFGVGDAAMLKVVRDPRKDQLIFPVFPTVYPPAAHKRHDLAYHNRISSDPRIVIQSGQKVLVAFCGSGLDAWLAWRRTQHRVAALDVNPLAVANTRALAKIAGFEVDARVADNIVDARGRPVFAERFDWVLGNMPVYPELPGGGRLAPIGAIRSYEDRWDADYDGQLLGRFASGLPAVLLPGGQVAVWNIYRASVAVALRDAGLMMKEIMPNNEAKAFATYVAKLPGEKGTPPPSRSAPPTGPGPAAGGAGAATNTSRAIQEQTRDTTETQDEN